ncbi:tRNA(Met) cytidine acetyltransferase [Pasteurellaceae bacterium LFhippo2]|nr:tRNA(Met) cytidine acetyltransferase [Pasteurellaceae bacterium LFhippo2]
MRHLTIVSDIPTELSGRTQYAPTLSFATNNNSIPFSNAKTLLGQEFPYAIYDMRAENGVCLNLDALAIVAGSIQENGTLFLVCPDWDNLENLVDFDSLRWNDGKAITSPNFYQYFKQLITEFGFDGNTKAVPTQECGGVLRTPANLTTEQQKILDNLPLAEADIHLITAPRGRGKSTLSGKLAEKLAQTHNVLITARSRSALPNFWKGIESANIPFYAPDKLIQLIESKQISAQQWLFIDEAASLPLPMLHTFCNYFDKVVLTTTTQNYEGTGRGFSLKFPQQITRSYQQWQLTQPLRWSENDKLEKFINQLLILENGLEHRVPTLIGRRDTVPVSEKIEFYELLANAHYKTTPTDLRRLFDAEQQQFYSINEEQNLIAGCWAIDEGGLEEELIQAIWRGERRPQGNLVTQYLCFQGNLPEACRLRSIRISRIAVQPEYQNQGYGKRLIQQIILQNSNENKPLVDFISVSFGLNKKLFNFWSALGFHLVQITAKAEASSGYPSAMMVYPISEQGKLFAKQANALFFRDYPLLPYPIEIQNILKIQSIIDFQLNSKDLENLDGFANAQRTLSSCYASLTRLKINSKEKINILDETLSKKTFELTQNKKKTISELRNYVKKLL